MIRGGFQTAACLVVVVCSAIVEPPGSRLLEFRNPHRAGVGTHGLGVCPIRCRQPSVLAELQAARPIVAQLETRRRRVGEDAVAILQSRAIAERMQTHPWAGGNVPLAGAGQMAARELALADRVVAVGLLHLEQVGASRQRPICEQPVGAYGSSREAGDRAFADKVVSWIADG